ncbi:MAG: MmcQ/YjbR family DNA-binding protein [Planctomycetes bacterium]|nr:MmcQ/YjbR family DNA-binding protein [Planctomycetota bacterium]
MSKLKKSIVIIPSERLLRRLRAICLPLPEAAETVKWGNPTFVAGKKAFAVLDRYHERRCIAFCVPSETQRLLIKRPGYFPAPYAAKYGWVCLDAEGRVHWAEVSRLILISYRIVALKRMINCLDARSGAPRKSKE